VVASSISEKDEVRSFEAEEVGDSSYLNRHNTQMFESGRSFSGNERHRVWFNRGDASFADLSDLSGADSPNDGRAVIAADFDDDGDVDLFVHNLQRERHTLYRNELGSAAGAVKVRLQATRSQHEAIGATVLATVGSRTTAQVLSRGAGFVSAQAPELVFGLGGEESAAVSVRWASGELESFGRLKAGARALLVEGAGQPLELEAHSGRLPDPLPRGLRLAVGERVPAISVLDEEGAESVLDPVALAGGETLYLNLWASYCGSCVKELPDLQAIDEGAETKVVCLSMDVPSDRDAAHKLLRARGAKFPGYYLGSGAAEGAGAGLVGDLLDIERLPIPTTLVLAADGTIEAILSGPIERK
jgi:thiol-disulfide isomerase/thioredoxin